MIRYVVASGWLAGKLKPKAKPKVELRTKRLASVLRRISSWESKLRRARTALRKLERQRRYYEKKAAAG